MLDAFALINANRQRENIGVTFNRKWKKMLQVRHKYQMVLRSSMHRYNFAAAILELQTVKQRTYFQNMK